MVAFGLIVGAAAKLKIAKTNVRIYG
jgi:hypothetical protein